METVIDCEIAPFDQRYELAELDVSVTELPGQKETGPEALIVGVEPPVLVVTTAGEEVAFAPLVLVTLTV